MASLTTRKNGTRKGTRFIQFLGTDNVSRTIHLGKMPEADAKGFLARVESLTDAASRQEYPDRDTIKWISRLDGVLHKKLAKAGLVETRETKQRSMLGPFIERYVESRTDAKPATKEVWRQGRLGLLDCFGADKSLASVTQGDADGYKLHLGGVIGRHGKKLSSMTIRKRLQFAKMIFRAAQRHRLIDSNPFADVSVKTSMPERRQFITQTETALLLKAAPSADWRSIIGLCRYGGLRCPSEVLSIRWLDVDWKNGRMVVHSPKTEHHPGKEKRDVPLFPELRSILAESRKSASGDAAYIVDERFRRAAIGPAGWRNVNLRTTFEKIVEAAGLKPWPRLFHNLRSSRQTELTEIFPSHVVCEWLGNSEDIAKTHYLKATPEHFARASGADAQQNAQQSVEDSSGLDGQPNSNAHIVLASLIQSQESADGVGFEPTVE